MKWWEIAATIILWLVGGGILYAGLRLTKEKHEEKGLLEYSSNFPTLGDLSLFGFIFGIILSLTYGVIMKYSPWWLAKTFLILLALLFFTFGLFIIMNSVY